MFIRQWYGTLMSQCRSPLDAAAAAEVTPPRWIEATRPGAAVDGAARAFVALVDETRDPVSGRLAQLFVDARVRGDRLVGRWIRRDHDGQILASGQLAADRA